MELIQSFWSEMLPSDVYAGILTVRPSRLRAGAYAGGGSIDPVPQLFGGGFQYGPVLLPGSASTHGTQSRSVCPLPCTQFSTVPGSPHWPHGTLFGSI